jgi:CheY-like chemotaxis protein
VGHVVVTARDGLEGLVKRTTSHPDVVLLDIMMPDVDGHRVLKQLLEENGGTVPFPVIVITGSPEGAAQARVLLGRENVFEKPFDPQPLLDHVRVVTGDS